MLARLVQLIAVVTCLADDGGSEAKRSETHGAAGSYVGCVDLDVASKEIHDRIDAVRSCTSLVTIGKGADRCWNPRRLCSLVFGRIYYADRCWNPRTLCSIVPVAGSSTGASSECSLKPLFVLQGNREPDGLVLQQGRYVTVFGPAAAIGVNSRVSFADRLRSSLGVPILNFGRGGIGPGKYATLLEGSPGFRSVAFHSAAVVIVVMAGRSSSDGVHDKVDALSRHAAVKAIEGVDPGRAAQLRNASMQNAEAEYVALARAIRRAAPAAASVEPKFVLLWMSQIRATGPSVAASCQDSAAYSDGFPQYFTCSSDRGERLRRIASSIDAQMIDAHTPEKRPPIPMDRCGCPPPSSTRNQTCTPKQARDEYGHGPKYTGKIGKDLKKPHSSMEMNASGENVLIGCSRHCARVQSPYYPNAAVHERAAEKLHPVLADALSRRGPKPHKPESLSGSVRSHLF